jgi:hypothetical protein
MGDMKRSKVRIKREEDRERAIKKEREFHMSSKFGCFWGVLSKCVPASEATD